MHIEMLAGGADSGQELLLKGGCAVALGGFDGLHKGHMMLIRSAVGCAKEYSLKACVFTFTSNTAKTPYITSNDQRADLLRAENIDLLIMHEFNDEFKKIPPIDFFYKYILKSLNAKAVIAGFNYHFGYMGKGDAKLLQKLCAENDIMLFIIPPVLYENEPISSTRIRNAVESGNMESARNMLGRDFSVRGQVVHGEGIGKNLGFPTANLKVDENHVMPPKGVYATKTAVDGAVYNSITNYGGRPTIKSGIDLVETHILNFDGYLYGSEIEVMFIEKLRDIKIFADKNELSKQISADRQRVEEILDKK